MAKINPGFVFQILERHTQRMVNEIHLPAMQDLTNLEKEARTELAKSYAKGGSKAALQKQMDGYMQTMDAITNVKIGFEAHINRLSRGLAKRGISIDLRNKSVRRTSRKKK